ncbi:MAG TPA: ATP-binding cassette domain-containing protein [Acidimicrobiales bacterium]|nr:ATP-binding cassette domain-containing protein [Acidimicrobiales bacterium]
MPEIAFAGDADASIRSRDAVVVDVHGVTAYAPNGTRLLTDVSFCAARGEVLTVVGPTGAGKTSLARAITGSLAAQSGDVRLSGTVAFVPQVDAFHAGLTLRQALDFAAGLRMAGASADARATRVDAVLDELGLATHARTKIGDLSGGQRKRASIAAQLLGDPDVLVLDEPTAGLDPGYEKVVLETLRALARSGRTIIAVTHSVDALHSADCVLYLAGGGVAFFGTPKEATRYFGKADAADVFLALESAPDLWQQKFRNHRNAKVQASTTPSEDTAPRAAVGARRQFALLVRRQVDVLRADSRHLVLLALQAPLVGALLWAVLPGNGLVPNADGSYSSKAGVVLLFIVLSATWLGVSNSIREIVRERKILQWEAGSGLSARAYVASKFVTLSIIAALQCGLVGFLATGRQHPSHRIELVLLTAVAGVVATALGLSLSAWSKSTERAGALLPVTLVAQLVLAGEWAARANVPLLHQARWLVSTRWALEAMAATLNGPTSERTHAVVALCVLSIFGAVVTVRAVSRTLHPHADAAHDFRVPRLRLGFAAVPATGVAVALSLTSAGAGVLALGHLHHGTATPTPRSTRLAAAPVTSAVTTPVVATPVTTPPVTAPAVTAPPVTTPPVVATPAPEETATTEAPVASDPQIVTPETPTTTPAVLPQPPAVTPTNATPTPSPLNNFFKLFTFFTPKVGK